MFPEYCLSVKKKKKSMYKAKNKTKQETCKNMILIKTARKFQHIVLCSFLQLLVDTGGAVNSLCSCSGIGYCGTYI